MTHIPLPGDKFFSHGTPVWPWPVILKKTRFDSVQFIYIFSKRCLGGKFSRRATGCSMIFEGLPCPVDRSRCAQRCCDGAATESLLRRRRADQLRRAHSRYSARRVRDGADAARSAAAAELRRSRCCDGAAQTSSGALILRVASATELMLLRRS